MPGAYDSRGIVLMELRQNKQALKDFNEAIRLRSEEALHLEPESEEALRSDQRMPLLILIRD